MQYERPGEEICYSKDTSRAKPAIFRGSKYCALHKVAFVPPGTRGALFTDDRKAPGCFSQGNKDLLRAK